MSETFLLPYILDHGFLSKIKPVDGQIWYCFLGAKAGFRESENLTVCLCCRAEALPLWAMHAGTVRPNMRTLARALRETPTSRRHG